MSKPRQALPIAVMTRRKVAQLNTRQLRNKDASKKKIAEMTQMLRRPTVRDKSDSPGNIERSSSKSEKSPNKNASPKQLKTYKGPKTKESPKLIEKTPVRGTKIQTPVKPKQTKKDEYYPNKMKRKTKSCKVVLKPIHGLKIGSKRKVAVPQKGVKSPSPKRIKQTQQTRNTPTIQEIIELSEQQGLSDEDFLEILTCESPVWWENPPDYSYDEDAICIRKPILHRELTDKTDKSNQRTQSNKTESIPNQIPEIKRTDNKFMTKRKKLENLLGNIKNKLANNVNINNNTIASKHENRNAQNETKIHAETKPLSLQINKLATTCSNKQNDEKTYEHQKTKSTKIVEVNVKTSDSIDYNKRVESRTSESTDGEDVLLTLQDNDILNDLENIDIPVQENEKNVSDIGYNNLKDKCKNSAKITETFPSSYCSKGQLNSEFFKTNNNSKCDNYLNNTDKNKNEKQEIVIDAKSETIDNINENKTRLNKSTSDTEKNTQSNDFIFKTNPSVDRLCTIVNTEDYEDSDIQKLTITSIEKISSPTLSDVDNSSCQEFDTISESNLKFIDEDISSLNSEYSSSDSKNLNDQICDTKEVNNGRGNIESGSSQNEILEPNFVQNEKDFESVEKITKFKNQKKKDKEYMTVYKIISCEDVTDNEIDIKFVPNDRDLKNIQKSDVFKKIISENDKSNEKTDSVKGNLNSFYKKCKSTYHRKPKSTSNNIDSEIHKNISIEQPNSTESDDRTIDNSISLETEGVYAVENEQTFNHDPESDTFCRSCEISEKSIVISDQNIVKYCLKCSSIFESENCTYCDKKAEIDKKNQQPVIKISDSIKQSNANSGLKFSSK